MEIPSPKKIFFIIVMIAMPIIGLLVDFELESMIYLFVGVFISIGVGIYWFFDERKKNASSE